MNVTAEETRTYLADASRAAEELRLAGVDIILVITCEYSIFSRGVFPGDTFNGRASWMGEQLGEAEMSHGHLPEAIRNKSAELNKILSALSSIARENFRGPITYSSGTWESVDWSNFDIVGLDYYRRGETAEQYTQGLDTYRSSKPLAVLEVGCCAYEGAAVRGDAGFALFEGADSDGNGKVKGGITPTRSEDEQADYISSQLTLLRDTGVDAVFVYVFSFPALRAGDGAKDLDMMSFSLVKTFPEGDPRSQQMPPWEPKTAFHRVGEKEAALACQTSGAYQCAT